MKFIEKVERLIKWDKPIKEQLDNLSQFDNLTESELEELTHDVKSTQAGILIEYLGYEKLTPHLPRFLEFLQDANWPASRGATNMLRKSGRLIMPEIKRIFNEIDDSIWHYWILTGIIQNWGMDLIKELKPELVQLIKKADIEGASVKSLEILIENNLISLEEFQIQHDYLLKKYVGDEIWITSLRQDLSLLLTHVQIKAGVKIVN